MLTWIYRLLALLLLAGVMKVIVRERSLRNQITFGLVLIPLVLRVLMIR